MNDLTAPSIESGYAWWLAALALLIASISFAAATCVPLLLKPMQADLGASTESLAMVHMAMLFGAGFGGLLFGRVSERVGFFPLALIGALAISAGLAGTALAQSVTTLMACVGLLIGFFGQGIFFSPMAGELSQWFDRHRALAIAIVASGQGAGGLFLAPVLRVSAQHWGWRETLAGFAVGGGALLLACVLAFRRTPPTRVRERVLTAPEPSVLSQTANTRSATLVWGLGACLALSCFATFLVIGHITAAAEEAGVAPALAAMLVSTMLGASLITRLGAATLGARWGHYRTVLWASICHGMGSATLAWSVGSSMTGMVVGVGLMGIGFGAYLPGYAVLVREFFPAHQAGRRIGEVNFLAFITSGLGSFAGGSLHDMSGDYRLAFAATVAANVLGLMGLLRLRRVLRTC